MTIYIRAPSHPDVPRPPNNDLVALALRVCHAIEACGASPELTKAVTLASDLHAYLQKPIKVDITSIDGMSMVEVDAMRQIGKIPPWRNPAA